jgi:hypothetical protein
MSFMKRNPKKTAKKSPLSFEAAIIRRAAHPQKGMSQPVHPRDTTAHDLAVEDGTPVPISHINDGGPQKF